MAKRIDADTKSKIDSMNKSVSANKQKVSQAPLNPLSYMMISLYHPTSFQVIASLIQLASDIKPQVHKNFRG